MLNGEKLAQARREKMDYLTKGIDFMRDECGRLGSLNAQEKKDIEVRIAQELEEYVAGVKKKTTTIITQDRLKRAEEAAAKGMDISLIKEI